MAANAAFRKRTCAQGAQGGNHRLDPLGRAPRAAGVRRGGTHYVYSLFGEEVVVPMFDLHFRALHVRGWWVSEWLSTLSREDRQAALQARGALAPPAWQP
jgi:hypothetical protein